MRDQECHDDDDATSIRALREGEQCKQEEEREEERRVMRRRRQRGCNDGIDEPWEWGDGAEPEQARRGRCDDDVAGEVEKKRRSSYARAHVDDRCSDGGTATN